MHFSENKQTNNLLKILLGEPYLLGIARAHVGHLKLILGILGTLSYLFAFTKTRTICKLLPFVGQGYKI